MNSLIVTVNNTPYIYECHTAQRAAEILAGTLAVMREGDVMNDFKVC